MNVRTIIDGGGGGVEKRDGFFELYGISEEEEKFF